MKKSKPPKEALERHNRGSKAQAKVAAALLADKGEWYDCTEDLVPSGEIKEARLYELARSITAGNRKAFKPAGQFEAVAKDNKIWVRAVVDFVPPAEPSTDPDDDVVDAQIVGADGDEFATA